MAGSWFIDKGNVVVSVTSHGAAGEVTGSCHLLDTGRDLLLLDCGMHQGGDAVRRLHGEKFGFKPRDIKAVVLSHAHLDHSGLLPMLVRQGFKGPIYCTGATRNLLAIMLEDSANIYFRDIEHANKHRKRGGHRLVKAKYDMNDVLQALKQCEPVDYHACRTVADGVDVCFYEAGHILGSAVVELTIDAQGKQRKLLFSGDLGNKESVLLRDPETPPGADLVMMESTYGNRDHRPLAETLTEMEQIIDEVGERGGVILMPSFAVGRTQELLFHLGKLYYRGKLKGWKVFLDSPMAIEVTRVYDEWVDIMARNDRETMSLHHAKTLEEFLPILTLTPDTEQSMQINRVENRSIIIAGSGMCTGGRIKHHFKHRIWKDNTHIVFVGFQAKGTLGRQLVDGARYVRMFGEKFAVKAKIHTLGGFSAHAGRKALLEWASAVDGKPPIRLVHGEEEALEALREALTERGMKAEIAEPGVPREF